MAKLYLLQNSSQATTAAPVKQPTGTAIRTMLQIQTPSTQSIRIVEWGCSFDLTTVNTPGQVELFGTTVAATMSTATVAADITCLNDPNGNASNVTLGGTTHTGFATAAVTEGTVANYRALDLQLISGSGSYIKQFPLGSYPEIAVSQFLRVRMTFGTTANAYIYVVYEE